MEVGADGGRAGNKSRSPNSWPGGLCAHGAVPSFVPHSLGLNGGLQVPETRPLFLPVEDWAFSAASPPVKPRTRSTLRAFSQRPHLSLRSLRRWSFCPQDERAGLLDDESSLHSSVPPPPSLGGGPQAHRVGGRNRGLTRELEAHSLAHVPCPLSLPCFLTALAPPPPPVKTRDLGWSPQPSGSVTRSFPVQPGPSCCAGWSQPQAGCQRTR